MTRSQINFGDLSNFLITGTVDGEVISYESSTQLWKNKPVSATGGGISGAGTSGAIAKFTGSSSIGNSSVTETTLAAGLSKLSGIEAGATLGADWNTNVTNKPTLGTAAAKNIPASGDASASEVVYGTDTRLTNARTPTAHTQTASTITDFASAVAALDPIVEQQNLAPTGTLTVENGYGVYVTDYYEIVDTYTLEIASGGVMEIG